MVLSFKNGVEKRRACDLKTDTNVRKMFPDEESLRQLGKSVIRSQIHPLIIRKDNTVIDGACRTLGVNLVDPNHEISVLVAEQDPTPAELTEYQVISSIHSNMLTPFDQASACKKLMELTPGATAKSVAEKICRDPSMVGKLLSVFDTTAEIQAAAASGNVGVAAWSSMSLLPKEDQNGLLEMHLAGLPAKQIADISRAKRKPVSTAETVKTNRIKCPVPGRDTTIQISGEGISLEDMIEAMSELTKEAKKANERGIDCKTFERMCRDLAKNG